MSELTQTERGFPIVLFEDYYENKCSVQISSAACYEAIWIGVDEANPQVMASMASRVGVDTKETTGWVPYPIPDCVNLTTRMYLTRKQAGKLAKILRHYCKTGELCELK